MDSSIPGSRTRTKAAAPPAAPSDAVAGVRALAGALLVLLATGCASTSRRAAWTPAGDPVADGQAAAVQAPPRDRLLWEYRGAAAALRRGQFDAAKRMLDDAVARLNGLYAPDKTARHSRGYFAEEAKKTFLGEPYERVMAYYYRGILYWMDGEPDNARACFRSAQLMDSDTEQKTYAADYALLDYLDGLATVKLKGDGADAWKRAQKVSRFGALPPYDPKANVLVFVEFGNGPAKIATGEYQEQLRFNPGGSGTSAVNLTAGGQSLRIGPWDDLTFQATTRGGRVMDHVLANKAVFKSATDSVGNVALVSGAILATDRHTDEAGLGLLLFGLASKIVSAATIPKADTRAWDNLPNYIGFGALALPPGQHPVTVEFLGPGGSPTSKQTLTIAVADVNRDVVVFVSDKRQ